MVHSLRIHLFIRHSCARSTTKPATGAKHYRAVNRTRKRSNHKKLKVVKKNSSAKKKKIKVESCQIKIKKLKVVKKN